MAERGTKRKCPSCGASYYDLNRSPIKCPKCDAPYVATLPTRGTPPRSRAVAPPPVEIEPEAEEEQENAREGGDEFEETDDLPSDDENFGSAGDENEDRD